MPELRDASTITYLAPDGTYITDTFAGPMWYVAPTEPPSEGSATSALAQEVAPDASGAPAPSSVPGEPEPAPTPLPVWLPIEPGFAEPEDDGRLVSAHAPVRVVLDPSSASEPFLSLRADGARVDWYLPQGAAAGVAPARDPSGRAADYHDVLPGGADLRVFPHADGAKTFIVLDAPPTSNRWEFPVEAPGLTLVEDDGAVRLVDDEGRSQGRVPDPFAVDSTFVEGLGSGRFSGDVAISVGQAGGRQTLIITVDPGFLGDATYPVYIDPTTIVPDDDGGAYDTFAAEGYPNDEFYAYQRPDAPGYYELWLGKSPDHPNDQNYPHIKFSGYLGTLGTVHVIKAELQVRPYHQYKSPTGTRIRRITDPWTSSTLNWNNRPSTTDMATGDSVKISTSEDKTASFIVTKAVQAFVDGTLTDNGFRLDNQSNGYTHWKRLIAADQGGSLSPKLRIVWYAPSATPSAPTGGASTASRTLAWTYSDGYSGVTNPQSHYQVQVSSNSGFSSIIADSTTLNGATDLVGPATSWTIPGSVTLTASTTYYWRVRAKDGSIWSPWSGGASFVFTVPPVFGDIAAPSEGGVAKGVITVTGTAAGASFTSYTLKYQVGCTPGGTLVDIGTNPRTSAVTNGTLGTWDTTTPTALADGQYLVVLTVAYATNVVVNRCVSLDTTSPVGSLAIGYSPDDLVRIDGTAYDAAPGGFSDYVLEYAAGESPGSGWALVDGSVSAYLQPRTGTEVDDAGVLLPLATWDTSALSPGLYTVRLTVHDRLANAPAVVSQVVLLGEPRQGSSDGGSEHTFAVGPDWTLGVGVADGELSLSRTLFTIPSYGAPQTMSIHYASGDADDDGLLGTGWSSDLTQRLEEVGSAVVVWHTADGSLLPYAWNGSAFVPPVGRFETLTHDVGNARYVLADPDGSYMRFADSGDGRLLAMCDRFDQCLDLAWGGSSVTATDESNRTTTLTLSSGRIATAVDSAGRDWAFTYTSGRLTEIVDPVGSDIDLTYGGSGGELTRVTAHRGGDVNWDIGYSSGVVTWVQDPIADGLGSTWRSDIVMDAADDTTVVKELETHTGSVAQARTEYTIDDDDLPVATEVESGATTTVTYDEHDLPATITNGSQGTTSVTYVDETGAVEREVAPGPDGPVTSEYAYEAGTTDVNSIVVKDDANAVIQETTQSCDHGELDSTTVDPGPGNLALTTSYTYTTRHQLRTETSPGGVVTRYEYDYDTNSGDPGNMTARVDNYVSSQSATSSRNVRTEYTYDPAGNVASETDPRGIVTTYAYDNLGRQTSATRNDVSGSSSDGDKDLIDETWYDRSATWPRRGTRAAP
ncbi:MAG: DNRLRE domain-containing protein [Chloroflexota bacterium]